jgi:hypothetical protein
MKLPDTNLLHNGSQHWFHENDLHREGGPSFIHQNGIQSWHQNGLFHREDGPSVIYPNGIQYWYHEDKIIKKEETT